jgi:hypothetical protein
MTRMLRGGSLQIRQSGCETLVVICHSPRIAPARLRCSSRTISHFRHLPFRHAELTMLTKQGQALPTMILTSCCRQSLSSRSTSLIQRTLLNSLSHRTVFLIEGRRVPPTVHPNGFGHPPNREPPANTCRTDHHRALLLLASATGAARNRPRCVGDAPPAGPVRAFYQNEPLDPSQSDIFCRKCVRGGCGPSRISAAIR